MFYTWPLLGWFHASKFSLTIFFLNNLKLLLLSQNSDVSSANDVSRAACLPRDFCGSSVRRSLKTVGRSLRSPLFRSVVDFAYDVNWFYCCLFVFCFVLVFTILTFSCGTCSKTGLSVFVFKDDFPRKRMANFVEHTRT